MIWVALLCLAAAAMAPLAAAALRGKALARGRQGAAMALHRAQLVELDRDLEQGRIGTPEHAIARLEIQRRLLAEASLAETEAPVSASSRLPLYATLAVVPVAALLLYLPGAAPNLPAAPLAPRLREARAATAEANALIAALKAKIATLDPGAPQARVGYVLLGNLEDTRGDLPAATDAWSRALAIRFDATLAAQVAEAQSRIDGVVSPRAAALFRQALAAAPPDAPWADVVRQRLSTVGAPTGPPPP